MVVGPGAVDASTCLVLFATMPLLCCYGVQESRYSSSPVSLVDNNETCERNIHAKKQHGLSLSLIYSVAGPVITLLVSLCRYAIDSFCVNNIVCCISPNSEHHPLSTSKPTLIPSCYTRQSSRSLRYFCNSQRFRDTP